MGSKPSRVEINRTWYDVREGWAGKLEFHEYMKDAEYFATEAPTVTDLWIVTDKYGSKVGEINMRYRDCNGIVTGVQ